MRSCHGGSLFQDHPQRMRHRRSFYLEDQSQPDDGHFVGLSREDRDHGREPGQLPRRTWQITDARGRTQHVHGAGVVGEQPLLEPVESFEYPPARRSTRRRASWWAHTVWWCRPRRELIGAPFHQSGQPSPERPRA